MLAFTAEELTSFWNKLPSKYFSLGADITRDLILNPLFEKKALERERQEAQLALEREKEDIQAEIDRITTEMNSKKDDYKSLKEKMDKIKEKDSELNDEMDKEKRQLINSQNDIKNVQKEIFQFLY